VAAPPAPILHGSKRTSPDDFEAGLRRIAELDCQEPQLMPGGLRPSSSPRLMPSMSAVVLASQAQHSTHSPHPLMLQATLHFAATAPAPQLRASIDTHERIIASQQRIIDAALSATKNRPRAGSN
jgi:hypothetical protein